VINLSADKGRVLRRSIPRTEAGRAVAVSDVVVRGEVHEQGAPEHAAVGRLALPELSKRRRIRAKLAQAGFSKISIEPTRVYSIEDARHFWSRRGSMWMRLRRMWKASS